MLNEYEKARQEWLEAKAQYEAAIKIMETSISIMEYTQRLTHEKWEIMLKEQKALSIPGAHLNVVKMPNKEK
jgi:hypothetical protein